MDRYLRGGVRALTKLHGDALITGDPKLARAVQGVIEVAPADTLL